MKPATPHGAFEIDHFRPAQRFPTLKTTYSNLYWACALCNRSKSSSWPLPEEARLGFGFVDPCREPIGDHLQVDEDEVGLIATTRKGQYTIEQIGLDSAAHRMRRRERREQDRRIRLLLQLAQTDELKQEAADLWEQHLGPLSRPWDSPSECLCSVAERQ